MGFAAPPKTISLAADFESTIAVARNEEPVEVLPKVGAGAPKSRSSFFFNCV
jgi:hypothetical protein